MALYCPTGHGPFAEWADRCPDCGRPLVGREPIVHLATAPNEPVAELWQSELRRAGIRTMTKALGPGFAGFGTDLPLEHALYVAAHELDRARQILDTPAALPRRQGRVVANPRQKR